MKKQSTINKNAKEELLNFTLECAIEAGMLLINFQKKLNQLKIKSKNLQGVVSTADYKSEHLIIKKIKNFFPESKILSEEDAYRNGSKFINNWKEVPFLWVIDPLDGTNNFLSGSDYYAVSIALMHYGKAIVGVVFRPATGDLFYSTDFGPSKMVNLYSGCKRKKLILPTTQKKLKDSILLSGFVSEKGKVFNNEFMLFKNMITKARAIRRMGSAALDICYVAYGMWDGFWEQGLAPWDIAAAGLIAKQAKAELSDYCGNYRDEPYDIFMKNIVVAKKGIYSELKNQLSKR